MKTVLYGLMATVLFVGTPTALLAQTETDTVNSTVAEDRASDKPFAQRLEEAKKLFKDEVSEAKSDRIARACNAAQTKIAAVIERTQEFQANHSSIYERWLTKLTTLNARISAAGADTEILNGYLQELNALIAQTTTSLESYIAGLGDVSSIDCTSEARTFYEALQAARAARSLVVDDTKSIVTFINDKIKPELFKLKQVLVDSKSSDGTTSDTPPNRSNEGGQ